MKYYLAEACQNTFVLLDYRGLKVDEAALKYAHRCLLFEDRDDALLLTNPCVHDRALYVEMIVLGADRDIAEFCGNGARAVAAYLFETTSFDAIFLKSKQGIVTPLHKEGEGIFGVRLPFPTIHTKDGLIFVDMLEPHLLIEKPLSDEELFAKGRELNAQKDLFPNGINVNAWHRVKEGVLHVKTYERGVQRLTKSCGTGSASVAAFLGSDADIITPGGHLTIKMHQDALTLIGAAEFNPIWKSL